MPEARFADLVCPELDSEVVLAQKSIAVATDAKSNAWNAYKIPIPSMSLIAVRYANATLELNNTQKRLAKLEEKQKLKNCIAG